MPVLCLLADIFSYQRLAVVEDYVIHQIDPNMTGAVSVITETANASHPTVKLPLFSDFVSA